MIKERGPLVSSRINFRPLIHVHTYCSLDCLGCTLRFSEIYSLIFNMTTGASWSMGQSVGSAEVVKRKLLEDSSWDLGETGQRGQARNSFIEYGVRKWHVAMSGMYSVACRED